MCGPSVEGRWALGGLRGTSELFVELTGTPGYRGSSELHLPVRVSCDACLKGNFRGRRFKCLICYDYDLCASCYESGATTTRHTTEHPMQCILTRVDYGKTPPGGVDGGGAIGPSVASLVRKHRTVYLYYGGDTFSVEQPQSFTCPYCGKMGFTETSLQEHVTSEHSETSTEVLVHPSEELNEPKLCEAEWQLLEAERADRGLFVQELLLSTLTRQQSSSSSSSSSSDEDERRAFGDFGAMGCVDITPLDVALENLQLTEGRHPPPPPL
ncbi:unnamed protein product [Menidia menidia]|uniref:E3 ubiquitin-protein ligase KCMF1 n=1 Tax=Menidia menidia TaxID=238744 RepID=A0A8S4ALP9_9TELE|nr:unnamed protein product [Menidia menidia]